MKFDDFIRHEVSRRRFLGASAVNAAGMAAGMVGLAGVAAAAPSERVRVAVIGVRHHGRSLATSLAMMPDVEVAALCDVDANLQSEALRSIAAAQSRAPRWEADFRRVLDDRQIDAVAIATPDHWHAPIAVAACQAGKDIYLEVPIAHTFDEGRQVVAAAKQLGRVIQSGLQQRSGAHFQSAIELVRSGRFGRVPLAKAWTVHRRKSIGTKLAGEPPAGVDYDLWLGPAPACEFNPNRFHGNWRAFWDYGSGELGNWGVHMLDVARWGLGLGLPTRVSAAGGKLSFVDEQETPDTLCVQFSYPETAIHWEHRLWSTHGIEGRSTATAFYGERGTLVVDRGGWKLYDSSEPLTSETSELSLSHLRDFVDCVKTRSKPRADAETGHLSTALCHLGNIAYRMGREVRFSPGSGRFDHDEAANRLLAASCALPG